MLYFATCYNKQEGRNSPREKAGDEHMDLLHLKYFREVAECQSITNAAKKLYVAQPYLSTKIRELEAELGIELFERRNRRIFLSEAGSELPFSEIWNKVAEILEIPEDKRSRKKASFYSELMLDSRFASLKGNVWDLRSRRKFEEVHAVTDVDDEDEEEVEETSDEDELDLPRGEEQYL